ncbi:MAG: hypothetical protein V3R85_06015 [Alphaproteobacteria bacterium]
MTESQRATMGLGGVLWAFGLIRILTPLDALDVPLGALLVIFVVISLIRAGWQNRLLCFGLAGAVVSLCLAYDRWEVIPGGIAKGAIFPAFFGTIVLLRATAEQRPEIIAARQLFAELDPMRRGGGLIVGANLLSAVLQVGMFAILAPIVGREAPDDDRRRVFLLAMRGMALTPVWSPFVIAMAVANHYVPEVRLWQIMPLGIGLALIGFVISIGLFDRGTLGDLWRALKTLAPIVPAVAIAALIVVGMTALTPLSTLESLVLGLPLPCLLAIIYAPAGDLGTALRTTGDGLSRIGPETSVLCFAMTLGVTFESVLPETGLLDWIATLALSPTMVILIIIFGMNLAGFLVIHPIVTGTILLVVFTGMETGLADLVLMQAMLVGWGLCTAISLGSLAVVTGSVMFNLPPTRLISLANIAYVIVTSAVFAGLLALLNRLLMG